jgi:lauroyl/myristoyl acyltransferase
MFIGVSDSTNLPLTYGAVDAPRSESAARTRLRRTARSIRGASVSAAVWILYVPHYTLLRLLGPRRGLLWARVAARVHWLLTFVGAQRAARTSLALLKPVFDTELSVSAIMRKHLEMKHECFARVRVYGLHGAKSTWDDIHWTTDPNTAQRHAKRRSCGRGLIIVGFHFGFFEMSATALSHILPGCNPLQLRSGTAHCLEETGPTVARIAVRKALDADRRSNAPICYIDARTSMLHLCRLLRNGGCVAIAADGMLSQDFVEVPFLDGTLRVASGWARLAAITGSDVLVLCDTEVDRHERHVWMCDHVQCREDADVAARMAVAEAIRTLDDMIRRQPWAWHPWGRLRRAIADNGKPRYELAQFRHVPTWMIQKEQYAHLQPDTADTSPTNARREGHPYDHSNCRVQRVRLP